MAKYRIVSKGNIVTIKSKLSLGNRLMSGKSMFLNSRFSAAVSDRDRKEKRQLSTQHQMWYLLYHI